MPAEWHHVIIASRTLEECLTELGTYCANENLHLQRTLENMKAYPKSWSYIQDKKMLNAFDKSIVDIISLNSRFHYCKVIGQQIIISTLKREV